MKRYIRSAVASNPEHYDQSITGVAYKVFEIKNGQLYPPMVANAGNSATPVGVWLEAEPGEFVEIRGLKRVVKRGSKRDNLMKKIDSLDSLSEDEQKKVVKQLKNATLAYRPGWHLGDVPRAKQFDSKFGWRVVDPVDDSMVTKSIKKYSTFCNSYAQLKSAGQIFYIQDIDKYIQIETENAPYFPYDFVWAECSYVMNISYQDEAHEQGHMRHRANGTFYRSSEYLHSLAGLKHLPTDGYYRYRTNPKVDTVPWVITGAMKVNKLLDDNAVNAILRDNGVQPILRQGGNLTLSEIMQIK